MKQFFSITASVATGILLFLSFPPFEVGFCGWIGLVPLIIACTRVTPRRGAFLGWLAGAVFFLSTLYWLRHVTWLGAIALALYSALYFIPFAVFISVRRRDWQSLTSAKNLIWMLGAALIWTGSEYVRATLFTGFPWNLLGVSQYTQIPLIQIAEFGGVYMVSALMVFVNAATAVTILQYVGGLRGRTYRVHIELMSALLLVAAAWSFGFKAILNRPEPQREPLHVALLQPNIPEVGNWELADPELIYERLETLSELALRSPDLDLMIWPETALPDFVRYSPRSAALVRKLVASGTPLLAGSMDIVYHTDTSPDFYNGSMLFNPAGEILGTYYKQHLVLFGEYIPFDEKIPLINALTPINSSFEAGNKAVVMRLPGDARGFSPLICFEDALPYLARNAARAGATWLVNQTNDSWFDPDCGSQQHLAQSVFRCVETRRPMLRCANTGITCAIDELGRITQTLKPRMEGFQIAAIHPIMDEAQTFSVRTGDIFGQACLGASVALYLGLLIRKRKTDHA